MRDVKDIIMIVCETLEEAIEEIKKKEETLRNKDWGHVLYNTDKELVEGISSEIEFAKIIWGRKKNGDILFIADDDEDEKEHWDMGIKRKGNSILFDVKSNHSFKFKTMWAEILNKAGGDGHIVGGKADYIAFRFYEDPFHFLVCKRIEIYQHLEIKNVLGKIRTTDKDASKKPYIPYGRASTEESIVRIPVDVLREFDSTKEIHG